uniref:L1 transposable element dsRBD-like domain-containing protein n=1 Tax=Periophthalmus magnuspinnatus TaxID=409849 RepID=A0A3B4AZX9_9GOBI
EGGKAENYDRRKSCRSETRINQVEDRVQNTEQVLVKMIKVISEQESKLIDQESWSQRQNLRVYNIPKGAEGAAQRQNLRVYNIPKGAEGSSMVNFVEKVLRGSLDIPQSITLDNETAHRAGAPKPNRKGEDKPRSVIIRFALQKRRDYAEAKRVLKEQNIRFQTPYPAKLRVFYQDGTVLYQTEEEATADMRTRGFLTTKITLKEKVNNSRRDKQYQQT